MNLPQSFKDRLTSRAFNAIKEAENLAKKDKKSEITSAHLAKAVFQSRGSLAYNILENHDLAPEDFYFAKKPVSLGETLKNALEEAMKFNYRYIGTEHLLWGLITDLKQGVKPEKIKHVTDVENHLRDIFTAGSANAAEGNFVKPRMTYRANPLQGAAGQNNQHILDRLIADAYKNLANLPNLATEEEPKENRSMLELFGVELVGASKEGKADPVIGREKEIKRIITVMSRRSKNNPMLIGDPGVGKTALVYGLAQKIASGAVPKALKNQEIYQLDLGAVVAGTTFRGEFEARLKDVLYEAEEKGAALFIDEFHTVIGAGAAQGSLDVANIIKPLLSSGRVQIIGATTLSEWRQHVEKDAALERRFQPIIIDEPDEKQTEKILLGLLPALESHHGLKISPEAVKAAVGLSGRYIGERFFPDKAIDVLDEAAALKSMDVGKIKELGLADIVKTLNLMTGIPEENLNFRPENAVAAGIEKRIGRKIIGQEEAVKIIASTLRRSWAGFNNREKPLGSFLFIGPTGVGKTELAKVLSKEISPQSPLIRFDMSEFSESHSVSKLIGAPPGYIGYEETAGLTDKVRRNPHSVVLFDEIEKAHPQIANILLQILEEGALTDNHGRRASFKNTIIILTSNLGAREFNKEAKKFGFLPDKKKTLREKYGEIKESSLRALRRYFVPELLSRLDEIIVFNPLGAEEMKKIASLEIKKLARSGTRAVTAKSSALELIARRAQLSSNGAREIKRLVNNLIANPLSDYFLSKRGRKRTKSIVLRTANNKIKIF